MIGDTSTSTPETEVVIARSTRQHLVCVSVAHVALHIADLLSLRVLFELIFAIGAQKDGCLVGRYARILPLPDLLWYLVLVLIRLHLGSRHHWLTHLVIVDLLRVLYYHTLGYWAGHHCSRHLTHLTDLSHRHLSTL